MSKKPIEIRHHRFLATEAMTVKFRGLAPEMLQHMSRTDSETLSEWIKDCVRFRLRYDLKGDLSVSEFMSLQPSIPSRDNSAVVDARLMDEVMSIANMAGQTDRDLALVMRMLYQLQHFMRAGIGALVFSNPNLNTKDIDGQSVFEEGKKASHEFLKIARGTHVE
ncbi:hypothetical protein ACSZM9_22400 [Aeromonas hydrophila]|uniref:hypothetical protein n=1 Tax=Aeromonas hydrophila TaxID=644 RepID=UPI003EC7F95C